jgi:hypothetical protein
VPRTSAELEHAVQKFLGRTEPIIFMELDLGADSAPGRPGTMCQSGALHLADE